MSRRLHYVANVRLPTEKAHGLQIMDNCEAFAAHQPVTLYPARRVQPPELRGVDPFDYYGLPRSFAIHPVPTLDPLPLLGGRVNRLAQAAFYVETAAYTAALGLALRGRAPEDVVYSRDAQVLTLARPFLPLARSFWEVHNLSEDGRKLRAQADLARRLGGAITITRHMAGMLAEQGVDRDRLLVAPDGFRAARFAGMPTKAAARAALGLPPDAFVVGYVGRLHTLGMGKGVDDLVRAISRLPETPIHLLLVGGPESMVAAYRGLWAELGLPPERFHATGHVPAAEVPAALAAFDVAGMPHPYTPYFAYYLSPLKLFEYMAAGCALLATDLPSTREIVTDGETALLVPPEDVDALATALARLVAEPDLRARLGDAARRLAFARYTWEARAASIVDFIARWT
jgi:glycosyltransferase involved in cell wall biosynthesis